jgi:hypothetical protein
MASYLIIQLCSLYFCHFKFPKFLTGQPPPRSRVLEKLIITQLVKKFPAFYGTRSFITVFTRALHWSLSWAKFIYFKNWYISYSKKNFLEQFMTQNFPSNFFLSVETSRNCDSDCLMFVRCDLWFASEPNLCLLKCKQYFICNLCLWSVCVQNDAYLAPVMHHHHQTEYKYAFLKAAMLLFSCFPPPQKSCIFPHEISVLYIEGCCCRSQLWCWNWCL